MKAIHKSDCAVYNMPAYPNGGCDCGAHLCATCRKGFGLCNGNPVFAIDRYPELTGADADTVIECDLYKKRGE